MRESRMTYVSYEMAKAWLIRFRKRGWTIFGYNPWMALLVSRLHISPQVRLGTFIGLQMARFWQYSMKKKAPTLFFCRKARPSRLRKNSMRSVNRKRRFYQQLPRSSHEDCLRCSPSHSSSGWTLLGRDDGRLTGGSGRQ